MAAGDVPEFPKELNRRLRRRNIPVPLAIEGLSLQQLVEQAARYNTMGGDNASDSANERRASISHDFQLAAAGRKPETVEDWRALMVLVAWEMEPEHIGPIAGIRVKGGPIRLRFSVTIASRSGRRSKLITYTGKLMAARVASAAIRSTSPRL